MNSNSLLCLLPLLTSVLALPAADLLHNVLDPNQDYLDHVLDPNNKQEAVLPQAQHAADSHLKPQAGKAAASNGGHPSRRESGKERATNCALFLCIRLLKAFFTCKFNPMGLDAA